MSTSAFVVVGAAHPKAGWFSEVARWSTAGLIPVEFEKCLSLDELEARLRSGRRYSAALVDGSLAGADRELLDLAMRAGVPAIVIGDAPNPDWVELGAAAQLRAPLDRERLVRILQSCGRPVVRDNTVDDGGQAPAERGNGRLLAVTGPGGTGTSTVAIAAAQTLAAGGSTVLLGDMARRADQAMLHDARDLLPGLPELVEAHRHGRLSPDGVRALVFTIEARGYDLLLGLRRARDWTALRPAALRSALASLIGAYDVVVADVHGDVEGEAESGSVDVEERNGLSRAAIHSADRVAVVGTPGMKGVASLVRCVADLVEIGIAPVRLAPVINRAPRRVPARAALVRSVGRLLRDALETSTPPPPILIPDHRRVELALRDGTELPARIGRPFAHLLSGAERDHPAVTGPDLVVPGSLGSWAPREAPT